MGKKGMLVLTRKPGQRIIINKNIILEVYEVEEHFVKIAIKAPKEIAVDREEIYKQKQIEQQIKDLIHG